jgi:hypothetical protein
MKKGSSLNSRRGLGGLAALAGGVLMALSVFAPWIYYPASTTTVTGWDTYQLATGADRWFTQAAFAPSGFSPGFSGMSVLIAGLVLALIGLAMVFFVLGAFRLSLGSTLVLGLVALLVFCVGCTNLGSLYATADQQAVRPGWGLFAVAAGALAGLAGVWAGVGRGKP